MYPSNPALNIPGSSSHQRSSSLASSNLPNAITSTKKITTVKSPWPKSQNTLSNPNLLATPEREPQTQNITIPQNQVKQFSNANNANSSTQAAATSTLPQDAFLKRIFASSRENNHQQQQVQQPQYANNTSEETARSLNQPGFLSQRQRANSQPTGIRLLVGGTSFGSDQQQFQTNRASISISNNDESVILSNNGIRNSSNKKLPQSYPIQQSQFLMPPQSNPQIRISSANNSPQTNRMNSNSKQQSNLPVPPPSVNQSIVIQQQQQQQQHQQFLQLQQQTLLYQQQQQYLRKSIDQLESNNMMNIHMNNQQQIIQQQPLQISSALPNSQLLYRTNSQKMPRKFDHSTLNFQYSGSMQPANSLEDASQQSSEKRSSYRTFERITNQKDNIYQPEQQSTIIQQRNSTQVIQLPPTVNQITQRSMKESTLETCADREQAFGKLRSNTQQLVTEPKNEIGISSINQPQYRDTAPIDASVFISLSSYKPDLREANGDLIRLDDNTNNNNNQLDSISGDTSQCRMSSSGSPMLCINSSRQNHHNIDHIIEGDVSGFGYALPQAVATVAAISKKQQSLSGSSQKQNEHQSKNNNPSQVESNLQTDLSNIDKGDEQQQSKESSISISQSLNYRQMFLSSIQGKQSGNISSDSNIVQSNNNNSSIGSRDKLKQILNEKQDSSHCISGQSASSTQQQSSSNVLSKRSDNLLNISSSSSSQVYHYKENMANAHYSDLKESLTYKQINHRCDGWKIKAGIDGEEIAGIKMKVLFLEAELNKSRKIYEDSCKKIAELEGDLKVRKELESIIAKRHEDTLREQSEKSSSKDQELERLRFQVKELSERTKEMTERMLSMANDIGEEKSEKKADYQEKSYQNVVDQLKIKIYQLEKRNEELTFGCRENQNNLNHREITQEEKDFGKAAMPFGSINQVLITEEPSSINVLKVDQRVSMLIERNQVLEEEKILFQNEVNRFENLHEQVQQQVAYLEAKLDTKEEQIEKLQGELNNLKNRLLDIEAGSLQLRRQKNLLESQLDSLRIQEKETNLLNEALSDNISKRQIAIQAAENECEKLKMDNRILMKAIGMTEQQLGDLRGEQIKKGIALQQNQI